MRVKCARAGPWISAQYKRTRVMEGNMKPRIKIGEAQAFRRHAIQIRRANARMTITAQIAVAQIVGENDDDVVGLVRGTYS